VTDRCPGCNAEIAPERVMRQADVDRYSCTSCGLQLVRRADGVWQSIRG
jgi:ribosomal protein L37AE/L43A